MIDCTDREVLAGHLFSDLVTPRQQLMRRSTRSLWDRTWLGLAMVLGLSALVGVWQARIEEHALASVEREMQALTSGQEAERFEQIEQTLAQAGCPGWMVLASEGPQALGPEVVPQELRKVSAEVPLDVPVVQYPQPIRVALNTSDKGNVVSEPAPANDPDDLLDGVPDLLWTTGEPASAGGEGASKDSDSENSEPQTLPPVDESGAESAPGEPPIFEEVPPWA